MWKLNIRFYISEIVLADHHKIIFIWIQVNTLKYLKILFKILFRKINNILRIEQKIDI